MKEVDDFKQNIDNVEKWWKTLSIFEASDVLEQSKIFKSFEDLDLLDQIRIYRRWKNKGSIIK